MESSAVFVTGACGKCLEQSGGLSPWCIGSDFKWLCPNCALEVYASPNAVNTVPVFAQHVQTEREECAKIAETWQNWTAHQDWDAEEYAPEEIAARIRSRK